MSREESTTGGVSLGEWSASDRDFAGNNLSRLPDPTIHSIIQHVQESVLVVDRDHRILAANGLALEILGLPPDTRDVVLTAGQPPTVLDDAGNRVDYENLVRSRALRGEWVKDEVRVYEREGKRRYHVVNGSPIFGQDGSVEMAVIVGREVTQIKELLGRTGEMLESIRRHERALQCVIDSMPAGVILLDSEFNLLAWNKVYLHYFEPSVNWRVGARLDSVLPLLDESGISTRLRRALRTGQTVTVREFRYDGLRKGVTYWRGAAVPVELVLEDGGKAALAMVVVEVTEEVLARQRLKHLAALAQQRAAEVEEERSRLTAIIESMPVALLVCDLDMRLVTCNSVARQYAETLQPGADISSWLGSGTLSGLQLTGRDGLPLGAGKLAVLRSLRGEVCKDQVVGCRGESGREMVFSVNSAPMTDAQGNVTGVIVAASDITQQMQAQEQIREIYRREHAVVEKLQFSFMLNDCPQFDGFEMAQRYKAALDEALVGGDFFDIFRVGEDKVAIVIADVAGKGLKAAVYTAMTKYMLRAYALEESAPELVLARLNEALAACTPAEVFVTLVYGVLDARKGTFHYANAGHEHPMHYSRSTGMCTTLDVTGRALALVHGSSYTTQVASACPGDLIVLYTDGITDAGAGTNRLGQGRLRELIEGCVESGAQVVADNIMSAALEFAGGRAVDDAALVIIKGC